MDGQAHLSLLPALCDKYLFLFSQVDLINLGLANY